MNKLNIVTHNGVFHADEVMACAIILEVLDGEYDSFSIYRKPHQTDKKILSDLAIGVDTTENVTNSFIVDIGQVFDIEQHWFDHHQYTNDECSFSSAGMILDFFKDKFKEYNAYESLKVVVDKIDENDIGVSKALPYEISSIIGSYNTDDIYNDVKQYNAFITAVNICRHIVKSEIAKGLSLTKALYKLECELYTTSLNYVCEMSKGFVKNWANVILDLDFIEPYDIVIWHVEENDNWCAQTIPSTPGGFSPKGRKIKWTDISDNDDIEFIHKGEFFMVAKSKEALLEYLRNM